MNAWGIAFLCFLFSAPAYGYVDPGTGSIALQLIFGAFAAAYMAVRGFAQRFRKRLPAPSRPARSDNE